jgi:hypothetical protein
MSAITDVVTMTTTAPSEPVHQWKELSGEAGIAKTHAT